MFKWCLLLIFSASIACAEINVQKLDIQIKKIIKEWEIPGLAIAIVHKDKIIFAKGYGVRDIETKKPVTPDTIFAIGSTTKAFTSTAIAMLVDDKKLKWDDKVRKYLPKFQLFDSYASREITIKDLLAHRSGLPRADLVWYANKYSRKELIRRLRYLRPTSSFRSKYGYQNMMYVVAGEIIPVVTGKSWEQFLPEKIFKPLEMKATNTSNTTLQNLANIATPHGKVEGKLCKIPWKNFDHMAPAGTICSNVREMCQWIQFHLAKGKYLQKQIINYNSLKETHSPQTVVQLNGIFGKLFPETNFLSYGLGWFVYDYKGRKIVEHDGGIDGMTANVSMMPDAQLGAVILTNIDASLFYMPILWTVYDLYLGEKDYNWNSYYKKIDNDFEKRKQNLNKKRHSKRIAKTSPSLLLQKYIGVYTNSYYGKIEITEDKNLLLLQYGRLKGRLNHWHYDTFYVKWNDKFLDGKPLITFSLNAQGQVAQLEFEDVEKFVKEEK